MSDRWKQFEADVLRRLDLVAEYKRLGLAFAAESPRPGGWMPAYARGREDKSPSAAVFFGDGPGYGTYHDSGGKAADAVNVSFFRFAAEHGPFGGDWRAARKHYAEQTGVKPPRQSKDDPDRDPLDRIEPAPWNPRMVKAWCEKKGGISVEAVIACGARMVRYPKGRPEQVYCLAFPAYPAGDVKFEPRAWVIVDHTGRPIKWHPEKDPKDKLVLGSGSGLVGKAGLEAIEDAEVVWKVEGLTDLLAATTKWLELPAGQRGKLAIVTTANGAMDVPADCVPAFAGKEVWTVHDCDESGIAGAARWCAALLKVADPVREVRLPGEVTKDHGYDLRDYFREGNGIADVLKLGRKAAAKSKDAPAGDAKPHHEILAALKLDVVGQVEDSTQIVIYSRELKKLTRLRDVNKFSVPDAYAACGGKVCDACLWDSRDEAPVGYWRIQDVRKAIAREAAHLTLGSGKYLGSGVWELDDHGCSKTVLVNAQEAAILNGRVVRTTTPRAADRILDFGGKKWVDFDEFLPLLEPAKSQAFADDAIKELILLFGKWNWLNPMAPELLAGLVLATFVQTVWTIRPMVGLCGSSNCGKTLLMDKLAGLFGDLAWRDDGTTAAALRQTVRHHATVCLIDEFEHSRGREEMLEMLRSSSRGATKTKGTAHQQAVSYGLKHIVWTSAIELGLTRAADKNRFLVFDLQEFGAWAEFPPPEGLRKLGLRLLAVALTRYRDAKARGERLKAIPVDGLAGRVAEILSVPAAMLAACGGLKKAEEAELFTRLGGGFVEQSSEIQRDEVDLLLSALRADIALERGARATILQAISPVAESGSSSPDAHDAAMRAGFRDVTKRAEGTRVLFVVPKAVVQKGVLRGTRFEGQGIDLTKVLLRLEGAKRAQHRMGGESPMGVEIPWETVQAHLNVGKADGAAEDAEPAVNGFGEVDPDSLFPEPVSTGSSGQWF